MSLYRIRGEAVDQNLVVGAVDYSDAEAYGLSLGWHDVAVLRLSFAVNPDHIIPAQGQVLG